MSVRTWQCSLANRQRHCRYSLLVNGRGGALANPPYSPLKNAKSTTTQGLAHRSCPREFPRSATRNAMIPLSAAALAYARQPGFSALIFSDVKPPTGQSAAYKQAAADDLQRLQQMGLAVLTENLFFGKPTGRRSERTTMAVVARRATQRRRWSLAPVDSERPTA